MLEWVDLLSVQLVKPLVSFFCVVKNISSNSDADSFSGYWIVVLQNLFLTVSQQLQWTLSKAFWLLLLLFGALRKNRLFLAVCTKASKYSVLSLTIFRTNSIRKCISLDKVFCFQFQYIYETTLGIPILLTPETQMRSNRDPFDTSIRNLCWDSQVELQTN